MSKESSAKVPLRTCRNCGEDKPVTEFRDEKFGANKPPRSPYCKPCKLKRREKPEIFFNELLKDIRYQKSRADVDDDVTVEFLLALLRGQQGLCALSGMPMTFTKTGEQFKKTMTNASVDRIDSSIHYTRDNIRLVTTRLNYMKHSMTDDEFFKTCEAVIQGRPTTG